MEAVKIHRRRLSEEEQKLRQEILQKVGEKTYTPVDLWRDISGDENSLPSDQFRDVLWRLLSEDELDLGVGNELRPTS